ncbi:hypothetical protein [Flagellimonas marina]|uniref:Tox-MPTase3 domain-containing protein n=1 Tax=Flagellimonas marina TaxID=1775168 RepID=A0ABV8PIJ7_9FLAO
MRKSTFPKFAVTLFLVLSLLFSCDDEQPLEPDAVELQKGPYSVDHVGLDDIPSISSFLEKRAGKNIFSESSKGDGTDVIFDKEDILVVRDSLQQGNYSLRFSYPDTPGNTFYNLNISISGSGEINEPYIYKYICDEDQFAEFEGNGYDMAYFSGSIEMHSFDSHFADLDFLSGKCDDAMTPCGGTVIGTPIAYSGTGNGLGASQPNYTNSTDFNSGNSAHTLSVQVYHTTPDGSGTFLYSSGGSQMGTCQHLNGCLTTMVVRSSPKNNMLQKTSKISCNDCGNSPRWGSGANIESRTKLLANSLKAKLSLSSNDVNFLLQNRKLVEDLSSYLNYHKNSTMAKNKARKMIAEAKRGELLSVKPYIKYPMGKAKEYAQKYPKLTEYLKNQLPKVARIPKITNAIHEFTQLPLSQIQRELQWGEGPEIHIVQLDNYKPGKTDEDTAGFFDKELPDRVLLDIDYVNQMENGTLVQNDNDAAIFFIGTTILHEYVHYGDFSNGFDYPGEEGRKFEISVYGENVHPDRARIVLNRIN